MFLAANKEKAAVNRSEETFGELTCASIRAEVTLYRCSNEVDATRSKIPDGFVGK